jgi:endogenous inhibitor of DNA gyrase (YacG/DUF329 family)
MNIVKCDICKKTIEKKSSSFFIGLHGIFSDSFEICADCGKPVFKLLKTKKLLKDENKKI